jgi:hypothetical protein
MKRRYNDGGEIKKKIADLQKLIKNPKTDAKFIPLYQKGIDKLQAKLQTTEPTEVMVATKMPKPRVEKIAPKMAKTTKPKAVERVTKSVKKMGGEKVEIDGVIYDIDSKEFCDYLVEEFKERRANSVSKKASKVGKPKKSNLIDNLKKGLVVRFEISKGMYFVSNDMFYDADDNSIFLYTLIERNKGKNTEREVRLTQEQAIEKYEMVKADSNYSINEFYE